MALSVLPIGGSFTLASMVGRIGVFSGGEVSGVQGKSECLTLYIRGMGILMYELRSLSGVSRPGCPANYVSTDLIRHSKVSSCYEVWLQISLQLRLRDVVVIDIIASLKDGWLCLVFLLIVH